LVPIRLIVDSSTFGLLDNGDELSADFLLTADSIREHTTTGGNNADAETSQRTWQVRGTAVNATPGARDAIDTGNDGLATAAVAERDVDQALTPIFDNVVRLDVALVTQHIAYTSVELVVQAANLGSTVADRVANAGEEIRGGVLLGHINSLQRSPTGLPHAWDHALEGKFP
jgi:hypothetical protein